MTYSFTQNQWGEKYIEELNRNDFSAIQSAEFFDRVFSFDLATENTCFVVCGSDSGLLLSWIRKQTIGRGSHIAVIENDEVYDAVAPLYRGILAQNEPVSQKISASPFGSQLSLHKYSQWQEEVLSHPENNWLIGGSTEVLESHASSADYARIYMPMWRSIKLSVKERILQIQSKFTNSTLTEMQFRNASDNSLSLKSSKTFGCEKTAVVLGGGPSIDLHLPWIEEHREQLFVIAVSRISGKLIERDFTPDLVVSVDPYDFSYEVCKPGLLWTNVPLAHNYHVSSKLMQQWQSATFCMGKRFPWQDVTQLEGNIPASGPTVGHTATIIAHQLGFSQILLTGIDLCFDSSASTHASGSPETMIQSMPSLCDAQVETYAGKMAGTSIELKNYVLDLEKYGAHANRDTTVIFNLNENAARCASIPYVDFKEVTLPTKKPELIDHIGSLKPSMTASDIEWLEKEFKRAALQFEKIRALCKDAKRFVEKIYTASDSVKNNNYTTKLTKLRKSLDSDYTNHLQAIIYYKQLQLSRANTPIEFEEMTPQELVSWGQQYYDIIDSGAKDMLMYIKQHAPRTQLRLLELKPEVDIRNLMQGWREDDTPGRLFRWKNHYWHTVKAEDRAWVQRTIGKLRSTLNTPTDLVAEKLLSSNEDIAKTVKSLVFLHQNQKREELESIESRLNSTQWPYAAIKPFTMGLISQLDETAIDAIAWFQATIDICSSKLEDGSVTIDSMHRLIEECLVRMTQCFLQIEDHKSALDTLGMLCEMLPSYIISYAKMLKLHGQGEFAVELLQSYTQLYPANKEAQYILDSIIESQNTKKPEENPAYVRKIAGALQAIMGN